MNIKERAEKLKTDIPAVYLALKDADTPFPAKVLAAATIAYALSPIDLIPDFIPVLGLIDDVIILPCLTALTLKLIPENVLERCREKAEGMWENGKPKKFVYALPIIVIWLLILWLVLKNFI